MKPCDKENEIFLNDSFKHHYQFVKISAMTSEQLSLGPHVEFVKTHWKRISHGALLRSFPCDDFLWFQAQFTHLRIACQSHCCFWWTKGNDVQLVCGVLPPTRLPRRLTTIRSISFHRLWRNDCCCQETGKGRSTGYMPSDRDFSRPFIGIFE